ncbi:YndM family protein [Peribacillus sp. SCS-155]|uniref:YndM family protein n=1 Tax=Peribacillus sedimenti TaxID=3115297 RepID=UPI0039061DCB
MLKLITVLLIKFITCLAAFAIGLDLFFDANMAHIISFSFITTVFSYIIGDRFILKHFGIIAATTADFILTYVLVWLFGNILLNSYLQIAWGSIISAAIITVAELFVHIYLTSGMSQERTHTSQQANFRRNLAYGTEFGEDQEQITSQNDKTKK